MMLRLKLLGFHLILYQDVILPEFSKVIFFNFEITKTMQDVPWVTSSIFLDLAQPYIRNSYH